MEDSQNRPRKDIQSAHERPKIAVASCVLAAGSGVHTGEGSAH